MGCRRPRSLTSVSRSYKCRRRAQLCNRMYLASFIVVALAASAFADGSASFQPSPAVNSYEAPAAYPQPQPYPNTYSYSEPNSPHPGYSIQTGYEGYLVPSEHDDGLLSLASGLLPGRSTFLDYLPKAGLIAGKVGLYLLGSAALLAIGTAFTVAVCTFTPICKLTLFGFPFSKESMRGYITPDRLTQATIFVRQAIDKYRDLQKADSKKSL